MLLPLARGCLTVRTNSQTKGKSGTVFSVDFEGWVLVTQDKSRRFLSSFISLEDLMFVKKLSSNFSCFFAALMHIQKVKVLRIFRNIRDAKSLSFRGRNNCSYVSGGLPVVWLTKHAKSIPRLCLFW